MAYYIVSLKITRNECRELSTDVVYSQHYDEHWDMDDKKFGPFEAPILCKVELEETNVCCRGNVKKYSVLVGCEEVDNDFGKFYTLGKTLILNYLGDKVASLYFKTISE